jgi:hypothetical protein
MRIEGKLEHVWIGLKVKASSEDGEEKETGKQQQLGLGYVCKRTAVPPVPPFIRFFKLGEKESCEKKLIMPGTPGTGGTPTLGATPTEERTCGKCACWHKPGCSYPDADPSCVALTNKYAADCRGFIFQEASQ